MSSDPSASVLPWVVDRGEGRDSAGEGCVRSVERAARSGASAQRPTLMTPRDCSFRRRRPDTPTPADRRRAAALCVGPVPRLLQRRLARPRGAPRPRAGERSAPAQALRVHGVGVPGAGLHPRGDAPLVDRSAAEDPLLSPPLLAPDVGRPSRPGDAPARARPLAPVVRPPPLRRAEGHRPGARSPRGALGLLDAVPRRSRWRRSPCAGRSPGARKAIATLASRSRLGTSRATPRTPRGSSLAADSAATWAPAEASIGNRDCAPARPGRVVIAEQTPH